MLFNLDEYKKFVSSLNDEEINIHGDDDTACWLFAYYAHVKYNLPILNYEAIYDVEQNINEINLESNGIYSYFMSHKTEFHHFILHVNGNDVILYSTYGGQQNIISIKYNKYDFIEKIKNLTNEGNIKKYYDLFGITNPPFIKLDLSELRLYYSFTYI